MPFSITPDPKFLYLTRDHREILASLIYGIHERRGIMVLSGDSGTGKTTLLNALMEQLDHSTKAAYLYNTDLTFRQLLIVALTELGMVKQNEKLSKVQAIQRLNEYALKQYENDGNFALIIDEAQNLSVSTLESLRLLTNLENDRHKLVQLVLSGSLDLDDKLNQPKLRHLAKRVSSKHYTKSLGKSDTYKYIQHRLDIANYSGEPLFSQNSKNLIWQYSKGIPRQVNTLCDNALLVAYGKGKKKIWERLVEEIISDLSFSLQEQNVVKDVQMPDKKPENGSKVKFFHKHFALLTWLAIISCLIFGIFFLIFYSSLNLGDVWSLLCQRICQ